MLHRQPFTSSLNLFWVGTACVLLVSCAQVQQDAPQSTGGESSSLTESSTSPPATTHGGAGGAATTNGSEATSTGGATGRTFGTTVSTSSATTSTTFGDGVCLSGLNCSGASQCLAPGDCAPMGIRAEDQCATDEDCFLLSDTVTTCVDSCQGKQCMLPCNMVGCAPNEECGTDGHCKPAHCNPDEDNPCPPNFGCAGEECSRKACSSNTECEGYCVNGACYSQMGQCVDCCPP